MASGLLIGFNFVDFCVISAGHSLGCGYCFSKYKKCERTHFLNFFYLSRIWVYPSVKHSNLAGTGLRSTISTKVRR